MILIAILLVLLPIIAVGAVMARKHFSLNKGGSWRVPQIAGRLQKLEVLYGRSLEDATSRYMERRFRQFMAGLGVLWILGLGVLLLPAGDEEADRIRRPDAGEDAAGIAVQLTDGEVTTEFTLQVGNRHLTEAEFGAARDAAVEWLKKAVLGDNASLDYVTEDLSFPKKDSSGILKLSWDTDALTVIGRGGTVRRKELREPQQVRITVTMTDDVHKSDTELIANVIPESYTESKVERVQRLLGELEESSRDSEVFELPEQMEGITVNQKQTNKRDMICKLYPFIILIAGILFLLQGSKEKERLKRREGLLQEVFYRFVKRLTLQLSAGESLQGSLQAAAAIERQFLVPEIQYTVNRIRTGTPESSAYAELGRSIGLRSYIRLFSTISTAAPRGSSQLLNLLEQEVKDAEAEAKEAARKKGEQATQKLLLPTVLLLAIVIGIVLFPAISGM
ncbi:MAG: type II secretion system F family protein [Eubacterium sp.]|nr:type II secretion system F family protein [Eubacterium sp.]